MKPIRSFGNNIQAKIDFTMREGNHRCWMLGAGCWKAKHQVSSIEFYLDNLATNSCVIPLEENPPSCIRFCIVTILVKSENITVM